MLIRESALLGLEPGRVAPRKNFSSHPGGANTPARITDDSYKGDGEGNGTRYPGMNVNPSNRDNHSGSRKEDSSAVVDIGLKGGRSESKSLRRQGAKRSTHVLETIADNRLPLASYYERIKFKPSEKKYIFFLTLCQSATLRYACEASGVRRPGRGVGDDEIPRTEPYDARVSRTVL